MNNAEKIATLQRWGEIVGGRSAGGAIAEEVLATRRARYYTTPGHMPGTVNIHDRRADFNGSAELRDVICFNYPRGQAARHIRQARRMDAALALAVVTPTEHEKSEWARLASAAYAEGRNEIGHRFSMAATLRHSEACAVKWFDELQGLYRSWLISGFEEAAA